MDFGEFAGKALRFTGKAAFAVGKFVVEATVDGLKQQKEYYDQMADKSEDELRSIVEGNISTSYGKRIAAAARLKKEYGYSNKDINELSERD